MRQEMMGFADGSRARFKGEGANWAIAQGPHN